ncbi:MAG: M3 family oligoendopeptidase [Proteobacteria bacterium]|nr:M3 family oligoendopeptidase [Pseudomonadota bacterium]MBI3498708.1 M3 family oligoendopeptidase [Pseudomonadota bacterium]
MARAKPAERPQAALGRLPEWDLRDLYPSPDSPELARDLDGAERAAKAFREAWAGRLAAASGGDLARAIADYERIDETLARASSYAQLLHAKDVANPEIGKFYQSVQERTNSIASELLFFTLELNRLEEAELQTKLADAKLGRYRPWLRDIRVFRDHQLKEEMERLLHEKQVAGRSAWTRLYDETMAALRFPLGKQALTIAEILNRLSSKNARTRRQAAESLGRVLEENLRLFSLITNTLAKDKEIEDRWRHYPNPMAQRNKVNQVEDAVVAALIEAVKDAYAPLSHRYYRIKAKWFGKDQLDYWDRNAPLPEDADRLVPWAEAETTVLAAYRRFSPRLAEIGQRFFQGDWIDAPAKPGKASGAFAHPTVPSAHPYLLLNYQGRTRDVMTLAHELGHGVHQVLAAKQGHLMADTPLTLAETASVFGEMLTFRALLEAEKKPKRRRVLIAGKVEDMLNTVVRQVALHEFEFRVHGERPKGELTPERLSEIWLDVQQESLGPAIRFDHSYRSYWAYIPHFVHTPFYVYAYAFGDCLVNSLYAVYQDAEQGFAERYLDMLAAGGTHRHQELLAPFGLNASDPAFWRRGLKVIETFVDELEAST